MIDEMIAELTGDLPRLEIVNGWNASNQAAMLGTLREMRRRLAAGENIGRADLAAQMLELGVARGPMVDRGIAFGAKVPTP
jgi:hypothetical protein